MQKKIKVFFKVSIMLSVIAVINVHSNKLYALTDNFEYVINTIGVPRYNVYNEEINEYVYNRYNIFCYGLPENLMFLDSQQYKIVENGYYNYAGHRVEFRYLGRSYTGSLIDNPYFPVDALVLYKPNTWSFIEYLNALNSWDISHFSSNKQREYMMNTQMLFDTIYDNGITNPYEQVAYGLTANSIGLSKVYMDTPSTWKTSGSLIAEYTRPGISGIRYAIFSTAPMEASSSLKSVLNADDSYTLNELEDDKSITLRYGAKAVNLTGYASESDVKNITSKIYINNEKVDEISSSNVLEILNSYIFNIDRNKEFKLPGRYSIKIKVESYLYTKFCVDGLLQDTVEKEICIIIEDRKVKEKENENYVNVENVMKLEKNEEDKYVVKELLKTDEILNENSVGMIQKGEYIALKLDKVEDIDNLKVKINDKYCDLSVIKEDEDNLVISFKIDNSIENTIATWGYLRNELQNYFNIDTNNIGNRIRKPYSLEIEYLGNKVGNCLLDVIDDYNLNTNYVIKNIINCDKVNTYVSVDEWIKE